MASAEPFTDARLHSTSRPSGENLYLRFELLPSPDA